MYSTELESCIGYTVAATIGITHPLVVDRVTQTWLLDLVRKQFLAEFGVRLAAVVHKGLVDRLPKLRRVSN